MVLPKFLECLTHEVKDMYEDDFHYASDAEWDRAEAWELGSQNPEQAWIATDQDVWHPNPFYKGPPVPPPEEDF